MCALLSLLLAIAKCDRWKNNNRVRLELKQLGGWNSCKMNEWVVSRNSIAVRVCGRNRQLQKLLAADASVGVVIREMTTTYLTGPCRRHADDDGAFLTRWCSWWILRRRRLFLALALRILWRFAGIVSRIAEYIFSLRCSSLFILPPSRRRHVSSYCELQNGALFFQHICRGERYFT